MSNYIDLVNHQLSIYLQAHYPEELFTAMNYSVKAGGKRTRPLLLLYTAEGFGASMDRAIPFACAMELIHTYSLIHDDLPSMDNDDFRRGKPTNHKVHGEAMAILAGDGLLNRAYEIMADECVKSGQSSSVTAMYEIALAAGVFGMIGGQAADIIAEDKTVDSSTLLYIHKNKTAALIQASLAAGAILGLANDFEVEQIKLCGEYLGRAFQIKDDLLDVQSTSAFLGKTVGSDVKNNKATYLSLNGLEKAEEDYLRLSSKAKEILEGMNLKTNNLIEYTNEIVNREN